VKTGTEALPTWIPLGGFRLDHRKGKTPEGAILTIDWLLPAWASDDLTAVYPCADQPCLHRILATCPRTKCSTWPTCTVSSPPAARTSRRNRSIFGVARCGNCGTPPPCGTRSPAETRLPCAGHLPSSKPLKEKLSCSWRGERLARQVTEKMAGGRFELVALPDEGPSQFAIRHRPRRLIDAIWQPSPKRSRPDHLLPLPSSGLWSVVPAEHRAKRSPVLLPCLPDEGLALNGLDQRQAPPCAWLHSVANIRKSSH